MTKAAGTPCSMTLKAEPDSIGTAQISPWAISRCGVTSSATSTRRFCPRLLIFAKPGSTLSSVPPLSLLTMARKCAFAYLGEVTATLFFRRGSHRSHQDVIGHVILSVR